MPVTILGRAECAKQERCIPGGINSQAPGALAVPASLPTGTLYRFCVRRVLDVESGASFRVAVGTAARRLALHQANRGGRWDALESNDGSMEPAGADPPTPEPDEKVAAEPHPARLRPAAHPPVSAQRLPCWPSRSPLPSGPASSSSVLPWTVSGPRTPLLAAWPNLKFFCNHTFVRGMISGIGLLDLWLGASDAVHYRDLR